MKDQTFKKSCIFILAIVILTFVYLIGTMHSKKIRVIVSQDANLTQNWSDKVKTTIVYPKSNDDNILDRRLHPKDHYIWVEIGDIAVSFNEGYSDIRFHRKENEVFTYVYHETRDKDINRKAKWFIPSLDDSPIFPIFTIYSLDGQEIYSCSFTFDNKIILYTSNNMDGIWDRMTIKENDISEMYKYDSSEKKWVSDN